MQRTLVMTVIGPDRPGLVESVASLVRQHQGNWLESRMSRLGGQFAGILRVQVPAEAEAALTRALSGLASRGLSVVVQPDQPPATSVPAESRQLELIGQDRPGIVQEITSALARHGVNVEELETECISAAMSGETLFKARARVLVPASADVAALKAELEKIASDLIVEVAFLKLA
jgi:glycine cleavage system regulatory protein